VESYTTRIAQDMYAEGRRGWSRGDVGGEALELVSELLLLLAFSTAFAVAHLAEWPRAGHG